jgi:hypothetical protein
MRTLDLQMLDNPGGMEIRTGDQLVLRGYALSAAL